MTDQNLLLQENSPADIKETLRVIAENVCLIGPLTMTQLLNSTADRIEQLERELAEARKDAERYRYWRDKYRQRYSFQDPEISSSQLDMVIDASIAKDKQ